MIKLGSNIASLYALRKLGEANTTLATTYERLSSGLRINRAGDDAAGLAVANSLQVEARIARQAIRNLNDGISLLNMAENAVRSLSEITTRLEELAQQAANGVYNSSQREALDAEAQALSREFFRIATSTTYNGFNLLNGDTQGVTLQAGRGENSTITVGVGGAIGTGTFTSAATVGTTLSLYETATGDVNGDGNLDLLSGGLGGAVIYLGNGDGTFTAGSTISSLPAFSPEHDLKDLNNDGVLDLIAASATIIYIALGNGDGTFAEATTYATVGTISDLQVGDLNGDGVLDIVTGSNLRTEIFLGTGTGGITYFGENTTTASPNVTLTDLNGDGILDMAVAGTGLNYYHGNGDGSFTPMGSLNGIHQFRTLRSADLNNDGIMDIIGSNSTNNTVDIYFGSSSGGFSPVMNLNGGSSVQDVVIGDLDGDGNLDIINANYATDRLNIFYGNGNGTFSSPVSIHSPDPKLLDLNDYNNDGVLDILSSGNFSKIHLGHTKDGVAPLIQFSLTTIADAKAAYSLFRHKRDQLALQLGEIGAHLARVEVAASNLTAAAAIYTEAESRIRDADIAEEAANLIKQQILQQAALAILAQANLQPNIVLKLLR